MDNIDARDQELIMEEGFHGLENLLSQKPTHFFLLILSMQSNGFQITTLISPINHIDFVLFSF